jgi:uncharacterized protein YndB with AHSA1/START domain
MMTMFGETGTLAKLDGVNVITFRRELKARPERVWEALTTADGITSWLAVSASVDGRPGGSVAIEFEDDQSVTGEITRWDPTSRFAHTWVINGAIESDLEYTLEGVGDTTMLTLVHSGLPDEICGGYTPGWHAFVTRLGALMEGNSLPEWMTVFEEVAPAYQ